MSGGEIGYRAWRADEIAAGPTFPESGYRPIVEEFDAFDYAMTPYAVLGRAGEPLATVVYHGRSQTWCCTCLAGMRGHAPCLHVAGVLWWVELARLRADFAALPDGELVAVWALNARRVRAIRAGWGVAPPNWTLAPSALFAALCDRGLATADADTDPLAALVAQCGEAVAA